MAGKRKRIVVVLGMHRSGTSAVARGLEVLGVELGERLMPPAPGNNEKGFWEDIDANALNRELMVAIGRDWDDLTPIRTEELQASHLHVLRVRAVELLRDRLRRRRAYGLKDPRMSVLLAFWKPAFQQVGADVSYVIASRHPLSVARSLDRRDGFEAEKSHYLWLRYVMAALQDTRGERRVVVSYDLLMTQPDEQLRRIARSLGLRFDPVSGAFAQYARDFLDDSLRHTVFEPTDLRVDAAVPGEVLQAYGLLERMARDALPPDSTEVDEFLAACAAVIDRMLPALGYISRRDALVARLDKTVRETEEKLQAIDHERAEREGQVGDLTRAVVEKDGHIANLQHAVAVKDGQIHGLNLTIAERETRLAAAHEAIASHQLQLQSLQHATAAAENEARAAQAAREALLVEVTQKDRDILSLQHAIAVKDGQIHGFNLTIAERDARLAAAREALASRDTELGQALAEREAAKQAIVQKDRDIANLQHALAVKDGQIHGLNLTIAERDARLAAANEAVTARDARIERMAGELESLDSARGVATALAGAFDTLRAHLAAEARLASEVGDRIHAGGFAGAAAPDGLITMELATREYARELDEIAQSLTDSALQQGGDGVLGSWIEHAFSAREVAWQRIESGGIALASALVESNRELEINRLRLLDSLREAARSRSEVTALAARIGYVEAIVVQRDAQLRERDRILGQFGHQFVSRVGAALDPYPGIRWAITAPLRLVHWILGHARA